VSGQRPKQGWIYSINPHRLSLRCQLGHVHIYNLDEPGEVECQTCCENINSSRVFRGIHPYIIWTSDQFQDESRYIATFSAENWLNRIGQLDKSDREAIEERLKYFLNIQENPSEDWFVQNASPELLKKIFGYLPEDTKNLAIEELINNLDS